VEERRQIWTPDFIPQKQEEDSDIKVFLQWFENDSEPDWNTVRAQSPLSKLTGISWPV